MLILFFGDTPTYSNMLIYLTKKLWALCKINMKIYIIEKSKKINSKKTWKSIFYKTVGEFLKKLAHDTI